MTKRPQRIIAFFLIVGFGFVLSYFILRTFSPLSFFLVFLTWFGLLILLTITISFNWGRLVLINLAAVILALGITEGWLHLTLDSGAQGNAVRRTNLQGTYRQGEYFILPDNEAEILGYGPRRQFEATSRKVSDSGEVIYDVTYTINDKGLRISPPINNSPSKCVLFFGGSFTFGEGVKDDEAFPYQVGLQSMGEIQTYNFGFHGYGPHQMLAALESPFVDYATSCKPTDIVYLAMPYAHIARLLGLGGWDKRGPWYGLDENGTVKHFGRFSDPGFKPVVPKWRRYLSNHWLTFQKVFGSFQKVFGSLSPIDDHAIQLYLGVISKAQGISASKYPGVNFHLVIWDMGPDKKIINLMKDKLGGKNISVHLISNIIQDYYENKKLYSIKIDGHPSPLFNKKIASYFVRELL